MTDAKDAQQDIVDRLVVLAEEQDEAAADYFQALQNQLDTKLRADDMAVVEREKQMERFEAATAAALDVLASTGSDNPPPQETFTHETGDETEQVEATGDDDSRLLFALSRLSQLHAPEGNSVVFDAIAGGYEIRSTVKDAQSTGKTDGVSVVVAAAGTDTEGDDRVVVELVAKQAATDGSATLALAYTTSAGDTTGWTEFQPGDQFERFTLTHARPERSEDDERDHVAIWADVTGEGGGIIVDELTVTRDTNSDA